MRILQRYVAHELYPLIIDALSTADVVGLTEGHQRGPGATTATADGNGASDCRSMTPSDWPCGSVLSEVNV